MKQSKTARGGESPAGAHRCTVVILAACGRDTRFELHIWAIAPRDGAIIENEIDSECVQSAKCLRPTNWSNTAVEDGAFAPADSSMGPKKEHNSFTDSTACTHYLDSTAVPCRRSSVQIFAPQCCVWRLGTGCDTGAGNTAGLRCIPCT